MSDEYHIGDNPIFLSQVLRSALQRYQQAFQLFVTVSLVYAILGEVGGLILSRLTLKNEELLFFKAVINILLASWASIAIIHASSQLVQGKAVTFDQALSVARRKYALYLAVYLTLLFIMGFGFILFVLPGLYFATVFLFTDILVVVENAKFRSSFQWSARLVRPFFWKVLSYLFIVIGISLIPELIFQLGSKLYPSLGSGIHKVMAVLIMPYLMIAQVELYYQIKTRLGEQLNFREETDERTFPDE
ncbi:MAG TPA: hypothetical protein VI749_00130 [Candidatus Omnitrophota bacterium]|nr:hypothetical protein [Candidatus Omnitrophota bacterium]